ncbi:MAG: diphthine synthase [Thermoplasmata archaeon]|jgi:diphthine synthase
MGELWFVGLGLDDERGLSQRALAVLGGAEEVFAEQYTAVAPPGTLARLEQTIGRPIRLLDRPLLESETPILDSLAHHGRVVLLVVGDPFAATTHVAVRLAAERAGHTWRYMPNASILTAAAGFLGLMHYRFGRTVSLPFPDSRFAPRSPVDQVEGNRSRGLHTLLLLDLDPDGKRYLTAGEALAILRERDPEARVLAEEVRLAVAARVGRDDAQGFFGPFARLRAVDFGPPMHAIVVPAPELHFEESAALERYALPDR